MTNLKQAVILAAGQSSRFWPLSASQHKCQINVLGRSLISWTIESLCQKEIKDIILIVGPCWSEKEELLSLAKKLKAKLSFIVQEKPLGTGQAISLASKQIKEPFFIFWPYKIDAGQVAQKILSSAKKTKNQLILAAQETESPSLFGILKLKKDKIIEIVEKPKKGKEPSFLKISGAYFLEPDFFEYYRKLKKRHSKDFVDALNIYLKNKKTGFVKIEKDFPELKYPWEALKIMDAKLKANDFKKKIPPDLKKGKNVVIEGKVFLGKNVTLGENTVIKGPCYIGDNSQIGANCLLRGPLNLEKNVVVGAFAEIKHCLIGEGTHFHSGYWGDSIIGKNCRFGAGFVMANRRIDRQNIKTMVKGKKVDTGLTYLGAIVGDNVIFGIHSGTMPGVLIGPNSVIGPGSLVFKNLKEKTFFIK